MPNLKPEAAFESMKARVKAAVEKQFPFEGKKRRLELVSLEFAERAVETTDRHHMGNIQAQYSAKTKGQTWGVPLKGTLRLVDMATGKAIEETTLTIALLPKITRRYSYIIEGNERQHDSVFRSMPRPYHSISNNGQIQADWNLARGTRFKLIYYPKNGMIRMKVGDTHIPVASVLAILGTGEATMEQYWGRHVFQFCKKDMKPSDFEKLFKALRLSKTGDRDLTPDAKKQRIRGYFAEGTEVWPDAMQDAFGKKFDRVNAENLLLSTKRLLAIQKGRNKDNPDLKERPDDREALSSKYLTSTEDFIVEAIAKKTYEISRRVRQRIDHEDRSISNIFNNHDFNKVINGVFDHAQRPDQMNPLQMLSGYVRTTIRGKEFGGVGSGQINVDSAKQINPTHLGFLDTIQSPESAETGIALHLPLGVQTERAPERPGRASPGHLIKTRVFDRKTKAFVMATPAEMERANVAFPDQVKWRGQVPVPIAPEVICYDAGRQQSRVAWSKVRYVMPSSKALFSFSANLIPFIQNSSGGRAMMAAKQQEQAVSLTSREEPLVQTKTDGNSTFEEAVGSYSAHASPVAGVVTKIDEDMIHIRGAGRKVTKVSIYNNFPLNGAKTFLNATPVVKVGETVKKGQLLADTNYTSKGKLAIGKNLRVAYIPYKGLNFEDGVVISETAAKKMTSAHMHQESVTIFDGMLGGGTGDLTRWMDNVPPSKSSPDRISHLDKKGVIKEGSTVKDGDVLVAVLTPSQDTEEDEKMGRLHRSLPKPFKDRSLVWDHHYAGKVVKVIIHGRKVTVHVRTEEQMVVGDKVTGRHGNKGIISRIIPDHKMPHDGQGKPVHMLLNPAGVPTRMNVGQVLETAASKIAKKTGKPYVIENFTQGVDYTAKVKMDLAKHGLSDTEMLFDPETKRPLGKVLTGDQYILKLHHMVDKKQTARSYGTYKGSGDAPSGAGVPGGGQKFDQLMMYSMLSHGAKHNLREAQSFKSDVGQQERFWEAVSVGAPLPPPQPTQGMKNFVAYLRVLGVNTEKKGDNYALMPLTDKQTRKISNGIIKNPEKALYAKGARTLEEHQGLFEPKITGGMKGEFWSHIELSERMPGPLYEGAIQSLLHMTKKEYEAHVSPKLQNGKSGFKQIVDRLAALDVDKELERTRESLPKLRSSALNKAYRRTRYLQALKKNNISPLEAYTNKTMPVIPPSMRKVSIGLDGKQISDDLNGLYLQVGYANGSLARSHASTPAEEKEKERAHLYDAIKGLRITGMSIGRGNAARHHTGVMEKLTGKVQGDGSPKFSFPQRGVLGRRQDLSGRSTIVPEPNMGLDEVGIPIPIALEMYKPFVIRELRHSGIPPARGRQLVLDKDDRALRALEEVVKHRPVILKRDPALHKFSAMAFTPKLIHGKAIAIHPLSTGGFNADFDGDAMALFVPVSDEAVDEAKGMMPSKNLFSPTHFGLMGTPGQGALLGLYQATKWGDAAAVSNKVTRAQVIKLMKDGKLKPDNVVAIDGKLTTPGRVALAEALPPGMRNDEKLLYDKEYRLDKKHMKALLTRAAKSDPKHFPATVNAWKDVGNELVYLNGSSISLNDFHDGHKFRDHILAPYKREEAAVLRSKLTKKAKDAKVVEIYGRARVELETVGKKRYAAIGENKMFEWTSSGARGNWGQFSQLVFGPMLVLDSEKKTVPVPLTKSYGEGLSLSEYWASMHGARKGILDRVAGTQDPGALTKDIINTAIDYQITAEDCGSTRGTALSPRDPDVPGRFLASVVTLKGGTAFPAGTLIDTRILTRIRNSGIASISVRSPLHCKMSNGICAMCYGHNQDGKLHRAGVNIGTIAGQSLGEPVTQLTMRTFHTGGVATGAKKDVVGSFDRVKQLFFVPKNLPNAATLATAGGRIEKAGKDARGGWTVVIQGKEHRVVTGALLPGIQVGALVKKGEPLSSGPLDPHDILKQTGSMDAVRGYISKELDGAYEGMTRRRNIETVVRAMTNKTMITAAPAESGFLRGQHAPLSEIDDYNARAAAGGRELVKHAPKLKAMTGIPVTGTEDWMARLNYRELKNTYQEGAAQGWSSDIHGSHPIPGLMHGAEFGIRPFKPLKPFKNKEK
jgi:DNA-directed RNA polymerase subunit beta'